MDRQAEVGQSDMEHKEFDRQIDRQLERHREKIVTQRVIQTDRLTNRWTYDQTEDIQSYRMDRQKDNWVN